MKKKTAELLMAVHGREKYYRQMELAVRVEIKKKEFTAHSEETDYAKKMMKIICGAEGATVL